MPPMTNPPLLSITCPVELENALKHELDQLAIPVAKMGRGVIEVEYHLEAAYRLVMWSRLANRVLLPVATFPLIDGDQFYESMKSITWEDWCEATSSLAIQWTLSSGHHHGQFFMYRLKDAICDRFKEKFAERPSVDTEAPDIVFHLLLSDKEASVYLDLGGGSLHKRGYRKGRGQAPLKENLAAALLTLADWHLKDERQKYEALLDPLCGSGTLLIEAALMRADRALGLLRGKLPCPGWLGHDMTLWKKIWRAADQRSIVAAEKQKGKLKTIIGFDADRDSIGQAIVGADYAGVSAWMHVERRDLSALEQWPRWAQFKKELEEKNGNGLVITNPPYGERLGNVDTVPYLHQSLGRILKTLVPGWTLALLSGSKQQAEACGVKSKEIIYRQRVHNGPIGCDFSVSKIGLSKINDSFGATTPFDSAQGTLAERSRSQPLRVLQLDGERYDRALKILSSDENKKDGVALLNRLRKNAKRLQVWIENEKIEAYRLYDADMPEFNIAVDVYLNHLHVQEYAPPATIDPDKAEKRFNIAKQTLEIIFADAAGVHCKVRRQQKGKQQYKRHDEKQEFIEVQEGRARLLVNLDDYLDTGLFLDHRPMRLRIAEMSKDKRFLNLFCYTGAATMHAAVGGAKSSVSVDMSPAYIQWVKANLALNGYSESNHDMVQADLMRWLPSCRDQFDLIFLDPPTFSNSKRSEHDFDVQKHHAELIDLTMKRLEPGGTLIFSNNFRRFVMDKELFDRYKIEEVTKESIPPDFLSHGKPIHRCWFIRR